MPAILVIGGLIALWLVAKHGGSGASASSSAPAFSRTGSGGSMPDPGASSNASMAGSAAHTVPQPSQITPFAGTAKLAPDQALARLNGSNRVATWQVGRAKAPVRVPPPPGIKTSNPATTPFNAIATNPISGRQAFGPRTATPVTTTNGAGRKI